MHTVVMVTDMGHHTRAVTMATMLGMGMPHQCMGHIMEVYTKLLPVSKTILLYSGHKKKVNGGPGSANNFPPIIYRDNSFCQSCVYAEKLRPWCQKEFVSLNREKNILHLPSRKLTFF